MRALSSECPDDSERGNEKRGKDGDGDEEEVATGCCEGPDFKDALMIVNKRKTKRKKQGNIQIS